MEKLDAPKREKFQAEMEERRLAREMALASQAWERTRLEAEEKRANEDREARRLAQEAETKRANEDREDRRLAQESETTRANEER